jgi:ArsR family transcriptional regulator, virulence genes transcriptional regulator
MADSHGIRGLSPRTLARGARVLRTLGHPLRLRLVEMLVRHEWTVSELAQAVGKPVSVVSSHLGRMHLAGLLSRKRQGKVVFYRVVHPQVARILQILHQEQFAAETFEGGEAI